MANSDRPLYSLQCDVAGCSYDIRCNDAPLLIKARALPVTVELPLNAWIRGGNNRITVAIKPPEGGSFDEDTELEFQVYRRQDGGSRESRQEVAKFNCKFKDGKPETAANVTPKENDFVLTQEFAAVVPFAESQWFHGLEIPENDQSREQILQLYLRFHDLLRAKDINAVMNLLNVRTAELAAAFYESLDAQSRGLREQFIKLFGEPSIELRDIQQTAVLRTYGYGKLARLELRNGESPVYYLLTKFNIAQYVSLVFTRGRAGEWIIMR